MAFARLAAMTQELSRRWGHLPPALPRSQPVPAEVVSAAIRRVQNSQHEPIDAELLARSLASVVKAGPAAESATERHLRKTPVDGEFWLQGLTDPALPAAKRAAWTAVAVSQTGLNSAELSLVQWFALPLEKRALPQSFMLHVPARNWAEWLAERSLSTRLEAPLFQALLLCIDPLDPSAFGKDLLRDWTARRTIAPLMTRIHVTEMRKIGGRLLVLAHTVLSGRDAADFRNEVRRVWASLEPLRRASLRGITAHDLGLTEAQLDWLNSVESAAEFGEFMESAKDDPMWRGERGAFWQQRHAMVEGFGYDFEVSQSRDRLAIWLKDGGFAVEFLDAGPLLFFDEADRNGPVYRAATSDMRSYSFRRDVWTTRKVDHRGYWYDKAIDELERFAKGQP